MQHSRPKILVAAAIILVAVAMLIGLPNWFGWPVLLVGGLLFCLGAIPVLLVRWLSHVPRGDQIIDWLAMFDRWFEGLAGTIVYDPKVAAGLQHLSSEGEQIEADMPLSIREDRDAFETEFAAWEQAVSNWTKKVGLYLRSDVSDADAYMFESMRFSRDAGTLPRLTGRLDKLRRITGRYLARNTRR